MGLSKKAGGVVVSFWVLTRGRVLVFSYSAFLERLELLSELPLSSESARFSSLFNRIVLLFLLSVLR